MKKDSNSIANFNKSPLNITLGSRARAILELFESPFDSITSRQIQNVLDISQGTAYYHLEGRNNPHSLVAQGLLKKVPQENPAIYNLSRRGEIVYRNLINGGIEFNRPLNSGRSRLRLRGHNVGLKADVLKWPDSIALNNSRFENVEKDYDMGWCRWQGRFDGNYFLLTNRSVVFKPHEVYGSPYQILFDLYGLSRRLFELLEADNPGLKVSPDFTFILGQEFAFEKDAFAKACVKLGVSIDTHRFKVDFSKGLELEFFDPVSAVNDAAKWKNFNEEFVTRVIDGEVDPKFLTKRNLAEADALLLGLSSSHKEGMEKVAAIVPAFEGGLREYTEQISLHMNVMRGIEAGVVKLNNLLSGGGVVVDSAGASRVCPFPGASAPVKDAAGELPVSSSGDSLDRVGASAGGLPLYQPGDRPPVAERNFYELTPAELKAFWERKRGAKK